MGAGPCHLIGPAVFAGPKDALHAGHQSAKMDVPDMLKVVELFLGPLKPHQKLWPFSGNTLRSRFRSVLQALKLPLVPYNGVRPLELASSYMADADG